MSKKAKLKDSWEAAVVYLVSDQEAIAVDQLARFVRCDAPTAESIVDHLEKAGLVQSAVPQDEEGLWIWLSEEGARLTGTESGYGAPPPDRTPELRLANEARLFAREMFPAGEWLSARVLKMAGVSPAAGVVRSGDHEYAVEIEPSRTSPAALARKYDRLRADHRSEGRKVVVLSASANVDPLERLRRERDWDGLTVRECPAFDGRIDETGTAPSGSPRKADPPQSAKRPSARQIEVPLLQIAITEFPADGVQAVQEAEGRSVPPSVTLVGRRIGGGSPRWRVTTETNVWRVSHWRGRWHVSPASADERFQKLLPPELKWRRSKANAGRLPLLQIGLNDLPTAALQAIQKAEGSAQLPKPLLAGKCLGCGGFLRFRVTTERGVWRVSRNTHDWHAWPADAREAAQEFYLGEVNQPEPAPRDPLADVAAFWKDAPDQLALVQIGVAELPKEALAAVQEAEKATSPPKVILAARRRGKGFPRYRITTERGVWRVGENQRGWHAHPSEEWERALEVVLPERGIASSPHHPLVEVPIAELSEEARQAIQEAEGISSPPQVRLVAKRKGKGFLRYRVTTERGVWRVSRNQHGWHVRPADAQERAQELLSESTPPDALVQRPIEDLPGEALKAIQEAEGSSSPPKVILVAKRKGRGFARYRVTTDTGVWLAHFNPRGWRARPAGPAERVEELLTASTRPSPPPARKAARPQPLSWVPVEDLPAEAMRLIAKLETGSRPPKVELVARRRGGGSAQRWRVTTDREVWRVTRSAFGWRIRASKDPERTQELVEPRPERLPKPCSQPLVQIGAAELPIEALQAVQEAEHRASPPKVIQAAKRKGRGFPRYRVTTEDNVWRVTSNPQGWHAWPAGPGEAAQELLLPKPVRSKPEQREPHEGRGRASKAQRQPHRRERREPARDAVEKGGR